MDRQDVRAGKMWFTLILFWHSLILAHNIVLYWIVLLLCILLLYIWTFYRNYCRKWSDHHLYNQTDCAITWGKLSIEWIFDSGLLSNRVMVFSIYIIPEKVMISSTNFTELRYFQNWSTIRLSFRSQYSRLAKVILYSGLCLFRINAQCSELIIISFSYLCSVSSKFSLFLVF